MIDNMGDVESREFVVLATKLAHEATAIAMSRLGIAATARKADNSLVTDADEAVQAHILDGIHARYPDHACLAEEAHHGDWKAPDPSDARFCWVIDPIDGTRNYVSGFPCFATSIAVLEKGLPMAAVVFEHNLKQCYAASRGSGATLDGETIRTKEPEAGADWLLGIPSTKDPLSVRVIQTWVQTRGFVLRNTGSTTLHLAMVGSGALSAAFAKRCKIWDIAAGVLIVEEAGGVVTSPTGGSLFPYSFDAEPDADIPFLAAPPALHQALLKTIEA